jgi:hypothetical protein
MEPEDAACHVVRAIRDRPRDYVFPWQSALAFGLLRMLPGGLFDRLMRRIAPEPAGP